MPGKGRTTVFPRSDNVYKKKESLPFDEAQSLVWQNRPVNKTRETFIEWFMYFCAGVSVGCTAFVLKLIEEGLIHGTNAVVEHILKKQKEDTTLFPDPTHPERNPQ